MRHARRPAIFRGYGASYDAAAQAWFDAVSGAGGSVSAGRKTVVNTLVAGLKADGIWTLFDRLWLFAAENTTSSLIDLKGLATATAVNSPTFTVDRGYTGGSFSYINTNYTPSTDATNLTLNSASASIYVTAGGAYANSGAYEGGNPVFLLMAPYTDNNVWGRLNSTNAGTTFAASQGGQVVADRTGSGNTSIERNGSALGSHTQASTSLPNVPLFINAYNNSGSAAEWTLGRIGSYTLGGSLGSSGRTALQSRINTYMTAVGANTY